MYIKSFFLEILAERLGVVVVRIKTDADPKEYWHPSDPVDPKFSVDISKLVREGFGERSHLYALEAKMNSKTQEEINLWDAVLKHLDKE